MTHTTAMFCFSDRPLDCIGQHPAVSWPVLFLVIPYVFCNTFLLCAHSVRIRNIHSTNIRLSPVPSRSLTSEKDRILLEGTPLQGEATTLSSAGGSSVPRTQWTLERRWCWRSRGLHLSWTPAAEGLGLNLEDLAC